MDGEIIPVRSALNTTSEWH